MRDPPRLVITLLESTYAVGAALVSVLDVASSR
jgi:hypothetical protein